ncbi:cytochrome c oxidase subunit 3 [Roseivivax sediminis]|uniref:Cytochrome c oxidase subunit 3 n=1 Tax=Roseivivax sediminis TaxID=936889 RepID=A0A1I1X4A4_9RHOB|nr:cytochrome c oxidase subunit 3 [Roseivivax sediminis]SFE02182.1 cytochrome c oxidase subunit 3 [Roseivivax sediminis]
MSEALHEPFEDISKQRSAEQAGIWIFLASEVIFFGGLFLGYAVYRYRYPDGFAQALAETNLTLGVVNTILLLCSSATMALSVWAGHAEMRRLVVLGLSATLLLGCGFLGVKGFEYYEDIHHHLVPGHPEFPVETIGAEMFFSLYWAMTALHGVHMAIGLGLIGWTILAVRGERLAWRETAHLHVVGLYWNLVDMVWIFLFPLLYLVGRM